MSTCNRLELDTLGSRPILPKNSPRTLLQVCSVEANELKEMKLIFKSGKADGPYTAFHVPITRGHYTSQPVFKF